MSLQTKHFSHFTDPLFGMDRCIEEMKTSPIEGELKTLQRSLNEAKKKCKGGAEKARAGGRGRARGGSVAVVESPTVE